MNDADFGNNCKYQIIYKLQRRYEHPMCRQHRMHSRLVYHTRKETHVVFSTWHTHWSVPHSADRWACTG
jgi:mRNA-degrading endonuclease RelE of RelBE toxin-antitoxin system